MNGEGVNELVVVCCNRQQQGQLQEPVLYVQWEICVFGFPNYDSKAGELLEQGWMRKYQSDKIFFMLKTLLDRLISAQAFFCSWRSVSYIFYPLILIFYKNIKQTQAS